jgi:hypothetical protein
MQFERFIVIAEMSDYSPPLSLNAKLDTGRGLETIRPKKEIVVKTKILMTTIDFV